MNLKKMKIGASVLVTSEAVQGGFSYSVGELILSLVPRKNEPFNIDVIQALNKVWLDIKSDDGEGSVAPSVKEHKTSGYLTHVQEKQGVKRETVVVLSIPKGYEKQYTAAIQKALPAFKVAQLDKFRAPATQK